eukprot:6472069-Amphidinium_carterae.3
MAMRLQNIQGHIKSHLLLTTNMSIPNFESAATTECLHRQQLLSRSTRAQRQVLQRKRKGRSKGKADYNYPNNNYREKWKGYAPYNTKSRGKEKYGSRSYQARGKGKGSYGSYNYYRPNQGKGYTKSKGKGKGGNNKPMYENLNFQPQQESQDKVKGSTKGKGKGNNIICYLAATTAVDQDIQLTSAGGKDLPKTSTNLLQHGHYK